MNTYLRLIVLGMTLTGVMAAMPMVAQDQELPEALEKLDFMLGSWEADRVEFLNEAGEVIRVSQAEAHNEQELDGRVIQHTGKLLDPKIETRGWYYWDREDERLHMGSVTDRGRYDEFVGGWEGDRLIMVTSPQPSHEGRVFRMIHSDVTDDSFVESLEISEDGGNTWRVSSRQTMRRAGAPAPIDRPTTLDVHDQYVGHWRTGDMTDRQGNTFHFEYDFRWIAPDQTLAKLRVTRVTPEETFVVMEGFKGLGSSEADVFFAGSDPTGRAARGRVIAEEGGVVTLYDGWSADGDLVQIRDVFTPVQDEAFTSRTYLRRSPEDEWRKVGEEEWRRMESP